MGTQRPTVRNVFVSSVDFNFPLKQYDVIRNILNHTFLNSRHGGGGGNFLLISSNPQNLSVLFQNKSAEIKESNMWPCLLIIHTLSMTILAQTLKGGGVWNLKVLT